MPRKIQVRVQTRSSKPRVEGPIDGVYKVYVNTPPVDGAANKKVIELLAKHFSLPKSSFKIALGHSNRNKVIEIYED